MGLLVIENVGERRMLKRLWWVGVLDLEVIGKVVRCRIVELGCSRRCRSSSGIVCNR